MVSSSKILQENSENLIKTRKNIMNVFTSDMLLDGINLTEDNTLQTLHLQILLHPTQNSKIS